MKLSTKHLPYDDRNAFGGVINYFRKVSGMSDPANAGLITLDASSGDPHNIFVDVSDESSGYWGTGITRGWIQLGFKKNRIELTNYTFYCYPHDFLYTWEAWASDDGSSWNVIDHKEMTQQPSGTDLMHITFGIDTVITTRFIRFVGTRERFLGDVFFALHRIELFGTFFSIKDFSVTHCSKRSNFPNHYIFTYVFITVNS